MGSMMESKLTPEQHALLKAVLVAQTEAHGLVETPVVEDLLIRRHCRRVLDIGCGEGSFLIQLARKVKEAQFVGIDLSELAVADASAKARRRSVRNVTFKAAFFDSQFERTKYDAIMTRYTLQHSSQPREFVSAVYDRLRKSGTFISIESLDGYMDCHQPDRVWEEFRATLNAIHNKVGSNNDIGKALGALLRFARFRDIQVRIVLCSPSTVGWRRFRAVVAASAEVAYTFFPDLFDRETHEELMAWLADRAQVERKDPYLCTAIANGTKP